MNHQDHLSQVFSALSDPTRRGILERLSKSKELAVTDLALPFDMSLPAITKHLKVLEKAKLITRSREAQVRPCKIEVKSLKVVDDWISTYRVFWEESFDRLDEYLNQIQKKDKGQKHGKSKKRK